MLRSMLYKNQNARKLLEISFMDKIICYKLPKKLRKYSVEWFDNTRPSPSSKNTGRVGRVLGLAEYSFPVIMTTPSKPVIFFAAVLTLSFFLTYATARRACNNGASNCLACVCNEWDDTAVCCTGEFNESNGNCEGILKGKNGPFKKCCGGKRGFGRCW
ncbi:hypothetical protein Fcan01_16486 [Folsomia candida]|uniref:Uncharacterized protein n=1 Tax=Folsomia candida TaxID=158441 RepID=A0A226DUE2_FOLCA|nr:hypothetical protein Fcan01_16486 [Folsomia candida]